MEGGLKKLLLVAACFLMVKGTLVLPWREPGYLAAKSSSRFQPSHPRPVQPHREDNDLHLALPEPYHKRQLVQTRDYYNTQCLVEEVYRQSVPKKLSHVERVKVLAFTWSVKECLELCCSLDPYSCQYTWLFGGRCVAVSCDMPSHCQPQSIADSETFSVYIKMGYTATSTNNDLYTDGLYNEEESHDGSDSPPVARVLSPVVVHLPESVVCLLGNESTDDEGIVQYHWRLVSDAHRGHETQLEGAESSVLCVSNLVGGVYLFELTITDTAGQTSRAGVIVDVVAGEQIASPSSATEVAIAPTRTHQSSHTEAPSQINQARVLPQASTARAPLQASQANVMTHSYTEVRYNSSLTTKTRQFGMTSQSHLSAESKLAHVIMASSIPQLPHEQAAPHRNAESVKRGTGSLLLWRLIIPVLSIVGLILALSATVVCVSTFIRLKVLRIKDDELDAYGKMSECTEYT